MEATQFQTEILRVRFEALEKRVTRLEFSNAAAPVMLHSESGVIWTICPLPDQPTCCNEIFHATARRWLK